MVFYGERRSVMVYNVLSSFCELQEIMGKNFVNPMDWHRSLNLKISEEEKRKMFNFPWDLAILKEPCPFQSEKKVAETHLLFWGSANVTVPFLADKFREIQPPLLPVGRQFSDYEPFRESLFPRWYLMPLRGQCIVDDSNILLAEHCQQIPAGYVLSRVVEEVAKEVFFYLLQGKCIFDGVLYRYPIYEETYNPASRKDSTQPKFLRMEKMLESGRQLILRCHDSWAPGFGTGVTTWHPVGGLKIVPFPEKPLVVFPVALSLCRDYPR